MRVVLCLFLLFTLFKSNGQEVLITKGKFPLGIVVTDTISGNRVDISTICESFNAELIPKNLILPAHHKLTVFLPAAAQGDKSRKYWRLSTSETLGYFGKKGEFIIQREPAAYQMTLIYEGGYLYNNDLVMVAYDQVPSGGEQTQLRIVTERLNTSPKLYIDTVGFDFITDLPAPEVSEVYLANEMDVLFKKEYTKLVNAIFEGTEKSIFLPDRNSREYSKWVHEGYIKSTTGKNPPVNPRFPFEKNTLFFRLMDLRDSLSIKLLRNNEEIMRPKLLVNTNDIVYLPELKTGKYALVLEDSTIHYNEKSSTYHFEIRSSFWQQGGYWLAILLPLFLILFLVYRTYTKAKLNRLVLTKQLTDAELTAIRAQLNPHFLFNALSAIQNLVNKEDQENANNYIVKLSRLMRLVLNHSSESFHSLTNELEIAELYLELEKLRSNFKYAIEVDTSVDRNMLVPTMLLQPYLENAVVHGIQANSGSLITMKIGLEGPFCLLRIKDNGIGQSSKKGNGKGMAMSSQRLKVIESRHGIETSVNAQATDTGYEVTIQIPTDL